METKLITVKVDGELGLLLEEIKKDYSINFSNLIRKLLVEELSNTSKYRRISNNV